MFIHSKNRNSMTRDLYFYSAPVEKGVFQKYPKRTQSKYARYCVAGVYNEGTLSIGIARCGVKDQFVKKIGRMIARGRAIKVPVKVLQVSDEKQLTEFFVENAKSLINEL